MKRMSMFVLVACLALIPMFAQARAEAQSTYPDRPVNIVVPFNAGGGTDIVGRMVADGLSKYLPEPVSIVNIGGAGSAVGMQEVYSSDPDGYTLLFTLDAILTVEATGTSEIGINDFIPIAQVGSFAPTIVTRYNSPYNDLGELIEYDLSKGPGEVPIATNMGAIAHFQILGLREAVGEPKLFRLVHIGDGAARISQTLGGHVEFTSMGAHEARPYLDSKEMKILAVMSKDLPDYLNNVPTTASLGINWEWSNEYYIFAPKETPSEVIETLTVALEKTMKDPSVLEAYKNVGLEPVFMSGEQLEQKLQYRRNTLMELASKYEF